MAGLGDVDEAGVGDEDGLMQSEWKPWKVAAI